MRLVILGATGHVGQQLLSAALLDEHVITAFVRDADKLKDQIGPHIPANIEIIEGEIEDDVALASAIRDQEVLISAAGNAEDGLAFTALFDQVISMAEEQMANNARAWVFGHAALLRVPETQIMTLDLPGMPKDHQNHLMNYKRLIPSPLNWSMLCPSAMVPAQTQSLTKGLRITKNIWPVPRPKHTKYLPKRFTTRAFQALEPELSIPYSDISRLILNNLSPESELSRMRIGVALPAQS